MTARDRFTVNQTVVATPRFFQQHRRYQVKGITRLTGIVRGFGTSGQSIRVQIAGQRSVVRYPMSEWVAEGEHDGRRSGDAISTSTGDPGVGGLAAETGMGHACAPERRRR
jgi:hypothetical protein